MVSVIIPIYNTAASIERCVNSLLRITSENLELILIDDGSQDNSLAICRSLAQEDSRIIVLSQLNEGASSARNRGLDIARGEYVMFVDSDDWIEPDMIGRMVNVIRDNPDSREIL